MSRMEDGLLSLKWNNHKSTFFHILSSLRKKETYTDATLACEGKFFPVHKLVMSTCSDYFSEIFERTNCKSPVVILKDIRYHDLESLLDYMYLGEVDVKQSELASLIKAAECLRIKGLAVPDEDPSLSHKKSSSSFESRASPSSKRSRTESSGAASDSQHYVPHSNKVRRSVSPTRSHSSSACGINTPVPSQSVNSDPLSQVPGAGLSMPPPSFSETKHLPGGSTTSDHQTSSTSSSTSSAHDGSNLVPVEMIKVEVEDDGNSSGGGGSNGSQLRRHHQDGGLPPPDQGGGRNERSCEDGGGEGSESEKSSLTNSYGAGYSSHPGEIEKEEHDQIDTFNGSDQMAGPSGVQGGSQMLNWGEEEGNFPHNLFGGEDSSHQQVCFAIMEPELLAVRMFQGTKSELGGAQIQYPQLRTDFNNSQIVPVEQSPILSSQPASTTLLTPHSSSLQRTSETYLVLHQPGSVAGDCALKQKPQAVEEVEVQLSHPLTVPVTLTVAPSVSPAQILSSATYVSSSQSYTTSTPSSIIIQDKEKVGGDAKKNASVIKKTTRREKVAATRRTRNLQHSNAAQIEAPNFQHSEEKPECREQDVDAENLNYIHHPKRESCIAVSSSNPEEQEESLALIRQAKVGAGVPPIKECSNLSQEEWSLSDANNPTGEPLKRDQQPPPSPQQVQASNIESEIKIDVGKSVESSNAHQQQQQPFLSPPKSLGGADSRASEVITTASSKELSPRHHRFHFCPYCQYRSRSKVDINKHIRIHTREKPYKCELCKYETGDKSNYKRHVSSVHKVRDQENLSGGVGVPQLDDPASAMVESNGTGARNLEMVIPAAIPEIHSNSRSGPVMRISSLEMFSVTHSEPGPTNAVTTTS